MSHPSIPTVRRWLARAGARAALAQAVVVVISFTLAGIVTQIATDRLQVAAIRERVLGEVHSLEDEVHQKGVDHLPHTIDKRTHLWRSFGYRLETAGGSLLGGDLTPGAKAGWRRQPGTPYAERHEARPFLVFTEALPQGLILSVGQDLSAQVRATTALTQTLLLCGALGVVVCIAASHAFSRRAWKRVAAIAEVARQVRTGRLEPRVNVPDSSPKDDLDDLALSFNSMLDRVEALLGQVRQVSVDIAHDLRTPLTRVRQRIERLQRQAGEDPVVSDGLRMIDADLAELLRVFDALLQLAEIDTRQGSLPQQSFDLAEVAITVAEAFRPDIEESGRRLAVRSTRAIVLGDERLMAQLIANLLENAIRHTPQGAHITVAVDGGSGPLLVVEDDGPGIPPSQREAVLRPLVRLEASRNLPGSGLGLSIVAAIANRHAAALALEDAAPGLRVRLNLPGAGQGASFPSIRSTGEPPQQGDEDRRRWRAEVLKVS